VDDFREVHASRPINGVGRLPRQGRTSVGLLADIVPSQNELLCDAEVHLLWLRSAVFEAQWRVSGSGAPRSSPLGFAQGDGVRGV